MFNHHNEHCYQVLQICFICRDPTSHLICISCASWTRRSFYSVWLLASYGIICSIRIELEWLCWFERDSLHVNTISMFCVVFHIRAASSLCRIPVENDYRIISEFCSLSSALREWSAEYEARKNASYPFNNRYNRNDAIRFRKYEKKKKMSSQKRTYCLTFNEWFSSFTSFHRHIESNLKFFQHLCVQDREH